MNNILYIRFYEIIHRCMKGAVHMTESRGFGFGYGNDWIWWVIIILVIICLCNPGFFGGLGFGCKE